VQALSYHLTTTLGFGAHSTPCKRLEDTRGQDPPLGARGVQAVAVWCPARILVAGGTLGTEATAAANVIHVLLTRVPGTSGFLFSL